MKHLKISGMVGPVEDLIQQMRVDELDMGSRFRWILIWSVVIGYTPVCISPVVTYAFAERTLDVTTIFTTMSYILLLANPLAVLFQMIPGFNASFTCLTRIQLFLEEDSRVDFRKPILTHLSGGPTLRNIPDSNAGDFQPSWAMKLTNGNFGWDENKMSLRDINIEIPRSRLTIVVGPVASGKSTLCTAILGEARFSDGDVTVASSFSNIGFCDQTPYLSNTTIQQNIIGFAAVDEARYHEVLEAAMLLSDLAAMPQGDQTNVGSTGITLSGGQKSRVCIARALYVDSSFLVFDDVLSGLDADTEDQVFLNIFSPSGLLQHRNTTAVLSTHSIKHLPSADHIVALGSDGTIVEQGTFRELMTNQAGYIHSLGVKETAAAKSDDDITTGTSNPVEKSQRMQPSVASTTMLDVEEDQGRILGDGTVYRHYLARLHVWIIVAIVVLSIGWSFFSNFNVVWLKFWSEDVASAYPSRSNAFYVGIYAIFQVARLASLFLVCVVVLVTSIAVSGARIHKEALSTVINAPLKFFATTDTGVVINLFSQDMTLIDGSLPMSLLNTCVILAQCVGIAAVIATSSRYLIITYPALAAVIWGIQKFYLRTSRQIRLLDLEAKSPL